MIPFIWAHLRGRAARSVALLLGVLTATTGFTVLTGATGTARLEVTGAVDRSAKAAYEILVRPKGARTELEGQRALVRPNSLSGIYGGLTMADYAKVRAVPGIDVAAPIAMVGYANATVGTSVDVTDLVDRSLDRQVLRIDRTFLADRGLSAVGGRPLYVYVTSHDVSWPRFDQYDGDRLTFTGGEKLPWRQYCEGDDFVLEDGQPVCNDISRSVLSDLLPDQRWTELQIVRLAPDGRFVRGDDPQESHDRLMIRLSWHVPLLLAAVDPDAEERLVGLRRATTAGRYLTAADQWTKTRDTSVLPVLASEQAYPDNGMRIALTHTGLGAPPPGSTPEAGLAMLDGLTGRPAGTRTLEAGAAYAATLRQQLELGGGPGMMQLVQSGGVGYERRPDGSLAARPVEADPEAYRTPSLVGFLVPWQIDDTAFRGLDQVPWTGSGQLRTTKVIGSFDTRRLSTFDPLSRVPMETYAAPEVTGADQRTRDLLGGAPLQPDGNPAGYLSTPPMLLTTLDAATDMLADTGAPGKDAPISAIRVRVAGLDGFNATSRERVRVVAEQIAAATGLDVDITYGSSPAPQDVTVAAGRYQRPALRVTERWTRKGVAAAIVSAVDRKSVVLFGLVLVVCALFLTNAVAAGVRDRRTELATLTAIGWPARRVFAVVLGEVAAIGLVAGAGTLLLALPLGALLDVRVSWGRALLAVPIAVALALLAGALPAMSASRARPARGLRPAATRPRRAGRPRGPLSMGLLNLVRVPGRTVLGAAALAIGITTATLLGAITFAFHGAIVGTLLGDAVSLQVRSVDTIAVVATVLLGAFAVADVLYLNIRDRSAELATLRATGWSQGALSRLVAAEGLGIGVLGGLLGAGLGLGGAAWLVGAVTPALAGTAAAAVVAGALLATVSALVPAALLQRMPTARLLAEE